MPTSSVPGDPRRELGRMLMSLTAVILVAAGALKLLDSVPGLILGTPRGVTRYATIEEAERALGLALLVPPYFPDTLGWPPTSVEAATGPAPAVTLRFAGRDGRPDRLQFCQALAAGVTTTSGVLPDVAVLETAAVSIEGARGRLDRVLATDGRLLHELTWRRHERLLVLRFEGPVDQLLLMAQSIQRNQR